MLFQTLFLLSASAVFGLGLKSDLEDLQLLYNHVDSSIKDAQHEAQIQIRATLVPLNFYINLANTYVFGNLSEAGQPYWATIASLEEDAATIPQDISSCVDAGNSQIYQLNDTTVSGPESELKACRVKGNEIILNSGTLAYSTIIELLLWETKVIACSDSTCAQELQAALIEFHGRGLETIETAVNNPTTYVFEELPQKLALINIDSATYTQQFNLILDDIRVCIDSRL